MNAQSRVTSLFFAIHRYTDEESRVYLLDRGNTREKEAQKERGSEKGRTEGEREWEDQETLDFFVDKETGKFLP